MHLKVGHVYKGGLKWIFTKTQVDLIDAQKDKHLDIVFGFSFIRYLYNVQG